MERLSAEEMIFEGPDASESLLILAHGAGAGMKTDFMSAIAGGVARGGVRVARFEFDYMRRRATEGKRFPPSSQKKLIENWRDAISVAGDGRRLFIGGKSMGGRIASMIADEQHCSGLVCLGYPFHPPGKPDNLRTAHLAKLDTPCLILQGERDPFGNAQEVRDYDLSPTITVEWLPDGDHSFKPRKKSGVSLQDNLDKAVESILRFISS